MNNVEYEAKVLDINPEEIRGKLEKLGAVSKGSYDFERYIFELNRGNDAEWLRLRTDGLKTTLAYKNANADSIDGVEEVEVEVGDLNRTKDLLIAIGYEPKKYQKNSRELYVLEGVEIAIDSWPGIPAYLEVEGKDTAEVEAMLDTLELRSHQITSKTVAEIYEQYGVSMEAAQTKS